MRAGGPCNGPILLAVLLACWLAAGAAGAQTGPQSAGTPPKPASAPSTTSASSTPPVPPRQVRAAPHSQRGELFYARRFGVDHLQVRYMSSGSSLEFRYRVVDAQKAQILTDKRASPHLIDVQTGTVLSVPTMEKIGALRQTPTLEAGREYWMVFSNAGKVVKPGQRVDVVVGSFRVEGLTVE